MSLIYTWNGGSRVAELQEILPTRMFAQAARLRRLEQAWVPGRPGDPLREGGPGHLLLRLSLLGPLLEVFYQPGGVRAQPAVWLFQGPLAWL